MYTTYRRFTVLILLLFMGIISVGAQDGTSGDVPPMVTYEDAETGFSIALPRSWGLYISLYEFTEPNSTIVATSAELTSDMNPFLIEARDTIFSISRIEPILEQLATDYFTVMRDAGPDIERDALLRQLSPLMERFFTDSETDAELLPYTTLDSGAQVVLWRGMNVENEIYFGFIQVGMASRVVSLEPGADVNGDMLSLYLAILESLRYEEDSFAEIEANFTHPNSGFANHVLQEPQPLSELAIYQHPSGAFGFEYPTAWQGFIADGQMGLRAVLMPEIMDDALFGSPEGTYLEIETVIERREFAFYEAPGLPIDELLPEAISNLTRFTLRADEAPPLQTVTYENGVEAAFLSLPIEGDWMVRGVVRTGDSLVVLTSSALSETEARAHFDTVAPTITLDTVAFNTPEIRVELTGGSGGATLITPIEITSDFDTFAARTGEISFEYPTEWFALAQRNSQNYVFALTNLDPAAAYERDVLDPRLDQIVITGVIREDRLFETFTNDTAIETATRSEATTFFNHVDIDAGEDDQTVTLLEDVNGRTVVLVEARDTYNTVGMYARLVNEGGSIQLIGIANAANQPALRTAFEHIITTIDYNASALVERDPATVDPTGSDLGANGFETWGPSNRALVADNATWISEPSFTSRSRLGNDTFDFYLTTDPASDLVASYIGFYGMPMDIQPGEYEIEGAMGDASFVTFVAGERFDTRADGVLMIDSVENGRISGSFTGESTDRPEGSIRAVFTDIEIPDVAPCVLWGVSDDVVSFNIQITAAEYDFDTVIQEGIWRIQPTNTYNSDFGAIDDDTLAVYFYPTTNPDELGRLNLVGFHNLFVAQAIAPLTGESTRTVGAGIVYRLMLENGGSNSVSGSYVRVDLTATGDTLSGTLNHLRNEGADDEVRIEGTFDGLPMPELNCRIVGE